VYADGYAYRDRPQLQVGRLLAQAYPAVDFVAVYTPRMMAVATGSPKYMPPKVNNSGMLGTEFEVCTECGVLHMEGGPAPRDVDECAVCGSHVTDVELDDLVGL